MFDPLIILAALACGIASRALGLPALIGYLAAGFRIERRGVKQDLTVLAFLETIDALTAAHQAELLQSETEG